MSRLQLTLVAIAVCFFIAGNKIADFAFGFVPVAEAGECVEVQIRGKPVKLMVLRNNQQSALMMSVNNGRVVELSHSELRDMDATKVSCE